MEGLIMSKTPFLKYLIDEVGIAETRAPDFAEAFDKLHSAMSLMDLENQRRINQIGLVELMRGFSEMEQVCEVMPTFETAKFYKRSV
jgi:hypothetical protein